MIFDASRSVRPLPASGGAFEPWRGIASKLDRNRLVLAGGLQPGNVRRMLEAWHPGGVDVASGIESSPGRKDPVKIVRFIKEVRSWDAWVGSMNSADSSFQRP